MSGAWEHPDGPASAAGRARGAAPARGAGRPGVPVGLGLARLSAADRLVGAAARRACGGWRVGAPERSPLMVHCLLIVVLYAILAILVLAVVEQLLAWAWPGYPPPVSWLLRLLVAVLIVLWIVGCVGSLPGPPALPR